MIGKVLKTFSGLFAYLLLALGTGCHAEKSNSQTESKKKDPFLSTEQCSIDTRNISNNFQAQHLPYQVTHKYQRQAVFTQGLQYHEGILYESSGLHGKSYIALRQFTSTNDESSYRRKINLAPEYFAEGISLHKGRLYQLTWTSGETFIYNPDDLSLIQRLKIQGEGWGVTSDGTHLYTSNGSSLIAIRNDRLEQVDSIQVRIGSRPLRKLNELEWIDGCLFANVWQSTIIAIINPADGAVTAMIDGAPLLKEQQTIYQANPESRPPVDVFNGIAFRDDTRKLLVTGKNWSTLYEIKLDSL